MERYQRVGVLGRGASATVVLARLLRAPSGASESTSPVLSPNSPPRLRSGTGDSEDGVVAASSAALAAVGNAENLRVIKEVELRGDEKRRTEALQEAEVLQSLSHPNIIAYHEVFFVDTRLCIVMEYADGGDLAGAISRRRSRSRRFLEREAMGMFVQLAIAMKYVHERRILHRDLKCKNVFLTRLGVVKLGDFGIAKVFDATDNFAETQVGTPYYLPPEMCSNQPYGFPADIWCLGVVFYELLSLEVPFSAPTVHALANRIINTEPHPVPASYSIEARGLVGQMLNKRPEERPTIKQIVEMPHVRRSAAFLRAAANGVSGAVSAAASEAPAPEATAEALHAPEERVPSKCASSLADIDLESLLAAGSESHEDAPQPPRSPPPADIARGDGDGDEEYMLLTPQRQGGEVARCLPGSAQALDNTMSCERLLHELEQEFNLV
mmetsp:Transcript_84999/g.245469  ORF Transcript_84999/g.245469 Transcript_84999/m.245469 type:complete len:440 (+) Transcript_84999:191-1510(+)